MDKEQSLRQRRNTTESLVKEGGESSSVSHQKVEPPKEPSLSLKLYGMLLFLLAMISYSFFMIMVKTSLNKYQLTPQEMTYYLSVLNLIFSYANSRINKADVLDVPQQFYKPLFIRIISGFLSDVFLYIGLLYTSYPKAICAFFTNTLMIPVIAHVLLNEKMQKADFVGIVIAFIGMLFIIQPFKAVSNDVTMEGSPWTASESGMSQTLSDIIGALCCLFAAFNSAMVVIQMRLVSQNMHNSIIGFHYFMGGCILSPLWSFISERTYFPTYSLSMVGFTILESLALCLMQLFMTVSFKYVTASASSIIIYVNIPLGYLLDYLFYGQLIGKMEIIGACLIVGVNVTISILKGKGIIK